VIDLAFGVVVRVVKSYHVMDEDPNPSHGKGHIFEL